ncbi:MAG: D-amino-acid transaminase [Azospirillaceae bacterium]|nr:D-amino-acid transaminase [Azospirillaceae bacterium]
MPRTAYVNGRYLPHGQARVHIEDRGFQFADGVYEVVSIVNGVFADEDGHLARLSRSLNELDLPWPMHPMSLRFVLREVARRNRVRNGLVYIQITRGEAPRDFRFPADPAPTLVVTCRSTKFSAPQHLEKGVSVITIPDIRWARRDIKSVALLPQVLGKQQAAEAGAFEAWQVDPDGTVTEGCSSNAWIVTKDGVLVTRAASHRILNGITRLSLLAEAEAAGIPFEERSFTVEEALTAREAFVSSASTFCVPVTRIDGRPVGDGVPGALAKRLRAAYLAHVGVADPVLGPVTKL